VWRQLPRPLFPLALFPIGRAQAALLAALLMLASADARAQAKFDAKQFIVVGEGLAAGMADFALRDAYQTRSFPAQLAKQMNVGFPQPLMEAPGLAGDMPGFQTLPPRLPGVQQGSVRTKFPPDLFVFNLSVPGMRLADSLNRRAAPPVIHQRDPQQTLLNMILGYPTLIAGRNKPLWTQTEYAVAMNPTLVLVELGYFEVLEAATKDDPRLLPDVNTFRTNFTTLLTRLKASSPQMIVLTIPDPFDTAFFTPVPSATKYVGAPFDELNKIFRLRADDLLTPNGLILVGGLILADNLGNIRSPLFPGLGSFFPGTVVSAATQRAVQTRLQALNVEITNAAKAANANVYDLQALFARVKSQGVSLTSKTLTSEYLGGFYSLDGYYPGLIGHGLIANEILQLINTTYKTSYAAVDLNGIAESDPVLRFTPALAKPPVEVVQ
ncbi:MAG: hypothetical protein ABIZ80_04530, partial [Bryobacteraceae bacterium]